MKTVHVAVGILINAAGAVLITRRPEHVHQGGLWEFPGGKVEEGEPVAAALSRELHEELGVTVESAEPWLHVRHDYSDKRVFLDVWRVMTWRDEPQSREGQPLLWASLMELETFAFPAADEPIIAALKTQNLVLSLSNHAAGQVKRDVI